MRIETQGRGDAEVRPCESEEEFVFNPFGRLNQTLFFDGMLPLLNHELEQQTLLFPSATPRFK